MGEHHHRQLLLGADAVTGARGAHVGHHGARELKGALSRLVDPAVKLLRLRPAGDHERLGAIGLAGCRVNVEPACRHGVPDRLGREGHEGVHEAKRRVEHEDEVALRLQAGGVVLEARLGDLDVPVAHLVPEKRLHPADRVAKGVGLDTLGHGAHLLGQAAHHPGIRLGLGHGLAGSVVLHVHEQEAARIPDLGHKGPRLLGAGAAQELVGLLVDVGVELDVLVVGEERQQVEAHRVGTVLVHEVHGVHAVALGLGHAAAVLGEDRRVDDHVAERLFVKEVLGAHDHAGNPERDDVARGDERGGGVMPLKFLGALRPALRGEGPQLRREPGVEHIIVLMDVVAAALGAYVGVLHEGVLPPTVLAVEYGDAVAPPELARDAPVFEVPHPGEVGLLPALGVKAHAARGHGIDRRALKLVDRHEPLLREPRLERGIAAVAVHDGVSVLLDVVQKPVLLKPRHHGLAALVARHAREFTVTIDHDGVLVEDVDLRQIVRLAHGVVVGVVRRGDLDKARAKARVHVPVLEDGNLAVDDGQHHRLAHKGRLLGIFGRDGNARVAEHGLGARGCHHDVVLTVHRLGKRVA